MNQIAREQYGVLLLVIFSVYPEQEYFLEELVELSDQMIETVDEILNTLAEREELLIRMKFGLDGVLHGRSYEDIQEYFGISYDRVRQIQSKTISKLRHPERAKYLRKFIRNFG